MNSSILRSIVGKASAFVILSIGAACLAPTFSEAAPSPSVRWVAYGGNQTGLGNLWIHQNLLERMMEEEPALVLHTGDLVAEGDRRRQWKRFLEETRELSSKTSFRPAVGAQDRSKTDLFLKHFGGITQGKSYGAFEEGPVGFIVLDTTRNFNPGSPQYRFLSETLESWKDRSPVIVSFHHPPFSGSRTGGDERVLEHLVPLFEKYGVDLVISGQERAYQRIGPINGVTYIVTGGGGAPLLPVEPHPAIVQYLSLYHYVLFETSGEVIRGTVKDVRGVVVDRFEIRHRSNPVPAASLQAYPQLKRSTRYFQQRDF